MGGKEGRENKDFKRGGEEAGSRRLEPPYELCLISGDWSKLEIPNLAQMSVMLLNAAKIAGLQLLQFLSY